MPVGAVRAETSGLLPFGCGHGGGSIRSRIDHGLSASGGAGIPALMNSIKPSQKGPEKGYKAGVQVKTGSSSECLQLTAQLARKRYE